MNTHNDGAVEQTKQPTLCVKCNIFFSNAACNDLCSKCHREQEATNAAGSVVEALVRGSAKATDEVAVIISKPIPVSSPISSDEPVADKMKPVRCDQCRKKVGLCGFKCRCGQTFCGQHRYAESHTCQFDYKTTERAKLTEANPVVQAAKVYKF